MSKRRFTGQFVSDNPVDRSLTLALLVLFAGAVVSWSEIGGPALSGPAFVPNWKFGVLGSIGFVAGIAKAQWADRTDRAD